MGGKAGDSGEAEKELDYAGASDGCPEWTCNTDEALSTMRIS
jgi:hypothetical protein